MEALEAIIKKKNINLDFSYFHSSSHGYALFYFGFSFSATFTSSYDEWLIDYVSYYHMDKDKSIFSSLSDCNKKK
jgi:hypothetical protein